MSLPLRERIVRKAKDKAVESLHEISTGYHKTTNNISLNNSNQSTTPNNKTTTKRANRSSYKPFAEHNQQSDEEQHQQSDEYETPTKKANRTKRKANTTTHNKTTTANKSSKQQLFRNTDDLEIASTDSSLFTQILSGQVSTQSIVDDWIESYKKNKEKAMLELIQFLVRSSGCKAAHLLNSKEILKSKEFTDPINELIENFNDNEESESYPFIQTSLQAKRFKNNFCEFLLLLINQCQYSIIYDQFMTDILITFLIALADSQVRAFRHTATQAVLKIMTGLVEVLLALSINKDAAQRQYENERQKSTNKRAADRIEMLTAKRKEIEENEEEIQNFINFIFKAVFVHRYRDICSDIRCVCINEIGEWMKRCPNKFLDDTFLKYIGWTMYDKQAECRLKCLHALQPLYEQDDLSSKLELFTSRFKNRIVEMSLDKDADVSVAAINLLTCIIKTNDSTLEDKYCENLYELVYHSNRQIAQAAGEFLNEKLFIKVENPPSEFKRGKKQTENSTFIQLLCQFLIESELHDHPAYLVDAMWDIHPMLKDWECMTDLLLEDPLDPNDVMDDTHERYLVEIMTCCIKQAATGEYPIARRQTNRKLNAKETKQVNDDRIELTQHFITTLPLLLTKYIADAEKLVNLLQIPQYFDLNQYTVRRQEKNLESLLKLLHEIVNKHNDSSVFEECSKCLAYLCDEDNTVYVKCNLSRSNLMDELVGTFNKSMKKFEELQEVDETEMYPLTISLKRLAAFAENHNIVDYDLVQNSLTILKWAVYNENFLADFVSKAVNLARSIITWNLYKLNLEMEERQVQLTDAAALDETKLPPVNTELIETIAKLSKKFHKLCSKLFNHDNPQIEEEAFFEICDLLILFNTHQTYKEYQSLIIECTTNEINMLSVYVMNNVFTVEAITEKPDSSERIEKLHKRRCILSAFCKLISFNCIPLKYAAEIFRGYVKYASSYGDIIKHLLANCREISKINTAKTIALCLQREFHEFNLTINLNRTLTSQDTSISSNSNETIKFDRNAPEFVSLKDLVRKFCLSFGPEASVKSRDAILAIHQESITYANEINLDRNEQKAPVNLAFLEVIIEFSSRLTQQDKKIILTDLDKVFAKRANKIESNNWMPYYTYRLSLMDEMASSGSSSVSSTNYQLNVLNNSNNKSNLMPAPLHPVNGSLTKRKRTSKQMKNNNISGISMLKDSILSKTKKLTALEEQEEEEESEDDENQEIETTSNDLESLKISTIKHNETAAGAATTGVRVGTRSSNRLLNSPNKKATTSSTTTITTTTTPNNKRSRSPLATNNSINESTDQFNILTSTRIETNKMINKRTNGRNNKKNVVNKKNNDDELDHADQDQDNNSDFEAENNDQQQQQDVEAMPTPKRKRKSDELNDDTSLLNISGNNKSVLKI